MYPRGLEVKSSPTQRASSYLFIQVIRIWEENYVLIKKCSQRSKTILMRMTAWHYADFKALNDTISQARLLLSLNPIIQHILWTQMAQVFPRSHGFGISHFSEQPSDPFCDRWTQSQGKGRKKEIKCKIMHKRKQIQNVRGRKKKKWLHCLVRRRTKLSASTVIKKKRMCHFCLSSEMNIAGLTKQSGCVVLT